MRPFDKQRVLLGVTGGIAAYKSAWIARLLTQAGAEVDVVLTRSASEFIGAVTFEALTGRPVHTALIEPGHALDHIKLARAASAIVVAPATADFLARAVGGHADDLLTACLLAATCPVMFVPAMNDRMWAHPQTQRNVHSAREIGYQILPPDEGALAVGEGHGPGRMPEPETIVAHVARLLESSQSLAGKRVMVTAGPTREGLDPVRFISNSSSGRMGVEIAAAAWRRGAHVTLVAGPLEVAPPVAVDIVHVTSTVDMQKAVQQRLGETDALVMAAAPADFTAASPADRKMKKHEAPDVLQLARTPDILKSTIDARKQGSVIVGFALETGNAVAEGQRKLQEKALDMVVVNDATEAGAGFGHDTNRVTFVDRVSEPHVMPLMSKRDVAEAIIDRVEQLLAAKAE
ncbi:MAG: bifunctional phosphopantothenoylcysteine decarboxylase/phosphopantothenate--cysteine ligase CoaBC [Gemmatimonas sp.]